MPWTTALRSTARSGFTLQRAHNEPLRALRGAVGAGITAFGALLLGSPQLAASAAIGAFIAGVATFQRSYRPRPLLALAAAAGLSLSTFVGYLASPWAPLFVLVVGAWAFMGGLAWSLGRAAGIVATNTISAMLIVVALTENIPQALQHAGVIAVGGVVQALLVVVWPIRRWGAQRDALADAYASMADYARRLRHDPFAGFDPDPLMVARNAATVTRRQARNRPPELGGRRGSMERMRPAMAALADPRVGAAEEGPERDRAREVLGAAAEVLDAVARSIRTGRPVGVPERTYRALALRSSGPVLSGAARQSGLLLIGLLADAADSLESPGGDGDGDGDGDGSALGNLSRPSVHELLPVAAHAVRRNWRWSSPVLRHAVRVGVVAAVGETIGMLLPFGHGYWAPLTAVMVMRPDFSQTYSRAVARIAGTALGVVLASLVIAGLETGSAAPNDWVLTALAVVSMGGAYLTILRYAAMSTCVAAYVVFLLAMDSTGLISTAEERVGQTLLGGLLALIAYAVFPTWQTVRLPDRLAAYIEAGGRYAAAAVAAFGAPSADSYRAVREALLDHRQARAELLTATGQAADEPVRHRGLRSSQLSGARSAMAGLGRAAMLLEAHLPPLGSGSGPAPSHQGPGTGPEPVPGAERFAAVLREETARAAQAVRLGQPVDLTAVGLQYQAWAAELPDPDEDSTDPRHLVARDARFLVAALEGLQQALRK